ncbi:MAG: hypothetical protein ABIG63_17980 [Chloroflexota bacterium]
MPPQIIIQWLNYNASPFGVKWLEIGNWRLEIGDWRLEIGDSISNL